MNKFSEATKKQYHLASTIKSRICNDLREMDNLNELNKLANTNYEKEELLKFFEEKDDFKYFISQNNINTNGIIVSTMMKLKHK